MVFKKWCAISRASFGTGSQAVWGATPLRFRALVGLRSLKRAYVRRQVQAGMVAAGIGRIEVGRFARRIVLKCWE